MELLIKTGPLFQLFSNTTLFGALGPEGWVEGAVERHGLAFRADPSRHPDTLHECMSEQDAVMPTARPCSRLEVPLDQAGRRSMFYLADGAWHHLAFRKNAVSGEQSIWLDGQCPDGFSHPQPNRSTGKAISQPSGLFTLLSTHFDGAIDEVALFEVALPDAMIAQHYADAMAHKPYSLVLRPPFSAGAPTPAPVAGLMDSREFAPGTICPGWSANCTPSRCNTTAGTSDGYYQGACIECITRGNSSQQDPLEQLRSFPSPRIVPSAQAQFGRHNAWYNFPWVVGIDSPTGCDSCKNHTCRNAAGDLCYNSSSYRMSGMQDDLQWEHVNSWYYNFCICGDDLRNESIPMWNAHPEIPFQHQISRGDVSTLGAPGGKAIDSALLGPEGSKRVARPECFLQNADGEFLMMSGETRPGGEKGGPLFQQCNETTAAGGRCFLRPCVSCEHDCGHEIALHDGAKYAQCAGRMLRHGPTENTGVGWNLTWTCARNDSGWRDWKRWGLNRSIELLFDDDEYVGWWNNLNRALDKDPVMVADYEKQMIANLPWGGRDWLTYTTRWRTKNTLAFNSVLLKDPSLPTYNATYGIYTNGGDTMFRPYKKDSWTWNTMGKWQEMRAIQSPGKAAHSDNHYGMSDFYLWNPDGRNCGMSDATSPQGQQALWDSAGAYASWVGLDYLSVSRPAEIAHGDHFFSPFISSGWSEREELNLRPAQTLGVEKCLVCAGAEYFHVYGAANGIARGENYIWQTAMPTYATASAMAVHDLWRNSRLLVGDMPLPQVGCYTNGYKKSDVYGQGIRTNRTLLEQCKKVNEPGCDAGDVVAEGELCSPPDSGGWHPPVSYRFWAQSQSVAVYARKHVSQAIYLIVGTVQPQSNMVGNAPLVVNASISIAGRRLALEFRRQGSVYVLHNTTGTASLTQVDTWHEATHPSYWQDSFVFEAELHASLSSDCQRGAETVTERRAGAAEGDFVGATTFVEVSPTSLHKYIFRPRRNGEGPLSAWVRWRSVEPGSCVSLSVDDREVGSACTEKNVQMGQFCWARVAEAVTVAPEATQSLVVRGSGGATHLDGLALFVAGETPTEGLC